MAPGEIISIGTADADPGLGGMGMAVLRGER
jgi:hypothetical protein